MASEEATTSSTTTSKLDSLSRDDLIKLIKKYTISQKQLKNKNEELVSKLTNYENNIKDLLVICNDNELAAAATETGIFDELKLKFKSLNEKFELANTENKTLNQKLDEKNKEIENLQREIELNKSILEMLNNEIKILNNDKVEHDASHKQHKQKRVLATITPTITLTTPEIIIEEDENEFRATNAAAAATNDLLKLNDYNKEIEDMTFYIDELKSELEAEREKSSEYYNEILNYKKQIEDFEDQYNNIMKEKENFFINLLTKFNDDFKLINNFDSLNNSNNFNNIEFIFDALKISLYEKFENLKLNLNETLKLVFNGFQISNADVSFVEFNSAIDKIKKFLNRIIDYFKLFSNENDLLNVKFDIAGDDDNDENEIIKKFKVCLDNLVNFYKTKQAFLNILNDNLNHTDNNCNFNVYINKLLEFKDDLNVDLDFVCYLEAFKCVLIEKYEKFNDEIKLLFQNLTKLFEAEGDGDELDRIEVDNVLVGNDGLKANVLEFLVSFKQYSKKKVDKATNEQISRFDVNINELNNKIEDLENQLDAAKSDKNLNAALDHYIDLFKKNDLNKDCINDIFNKFEENSKLNELLNVLKVQFVEHFNQKNQLNELQLKFDEKSKANDSDILKYENENKLLRDKISDLEKLNENIVGNFKCFLQFMIKLANNAEEINENFEANNLEFLNEFMSEFKLILLKHYNQIKTQSYEIENLKISLKNYENNKEEVENNVSENVDINCFRNIIEILKAQEINENLFDGLQFNDAILNELILVFKNNLQKHFERIRGDKAAAESQCKELEVRFNHDNKQIENRVKELEDALSSEKENQSKLAARFENSGNLLTEILKNFENHGKFSVDIINNIFGGKNAHDEDLFVELKNSLKQMLLRITQQFQTEIDCFNEKFNKLNQEKETVINEYEAKIVEYSKIETSFKEQENVYSNKIQQLEKDLSIVEERLHLAETNHDNFGKSLIEILKSLENGESFDNDLINKFEAGDNNETALLSDVKNQLKQIFIKFSSQNKSEVDQLNEKLAQLNDEKETITKNFETQLTQRNQINFEDQLKDQESKFVEEHEQFKSKINKLENELSQERENFNKIIVKYDNYTKTFFDIFNLIDNQEKLSVESINQINEINSNGDALLDEAKAQLKNILLKNLNKTKIEVDELNEKFNQEKESISKNYEIKLKQQESASAKLQTDLEKLQKDSQKTNVMQLELADYDRTINNLNAQLTAKDKQLQEVKQEITNLNNKINKLNSDIKNFEQEKQQSDEKTQKLKQLLVKAKKELNDAKQHETDHINQEAILKAQIEKYTIEIENYKLQMTETFSDKQKLIDKYQLTNNNNIKKIADLEKINENLETEFNNLKESQDSLKAEYENYKIRVQHAFKKQKEQLNEQPSAQANSLTIQNSIEFLNKENSSLKLVIEQLNEKLKESQLIINSLEKEKELLQDEYERSLDRYTKLITDTKANEQQIKQKYEDIIEDNRMKYIDIERQIEFLKSENEALKQTHKEHLKEFKSEQCRIVDLLQTQLEDARNEIKMLKERENDLTRTQSENSLSQFSDYDLKTTIKQQQQQQLQSSQISQTKPNDANKLLNTFEELLDAKQQDFDKLSTSMYSNNDEVEGFKDEISKLKIKIEHLTELLNETELNNLRLTEQINLLKEEIRRLERNQEREKSISNLEYLKNVVYKYLTFQSSQEKLQLLPVLSTILKLSQEEQNNLLNSINPKAGESAGSSSWGSYWNKFA